MEVVSDQDIMNNRKYEYITIMTDSNFCCYTLNSKYYCTEEYYYWIVNEIFELCNRINEYNKIVRIVKIPAHDGYTGNELSDFWAKIGAKEALINLKMMMVILYKKFNCQYK